MATTDVSVHNHGNEDTEASFNEADVTTWLTVKVGDSKRSSERLGSVSPKVTFFINRDQAIAIARDIMDSAEGWAKV